MNPDIESWLSAVECLSHLERRHILWHDVAPRYPRFLYKYRSIHLAETLSQDRLKSIIVDSKLWLSAVADLNDPFEMSASVVARGTDAEKEVALRRIIRNAGHFVTEEGRLLEKLFPTPLAQLEDIAKRAHSQTLAEIGVCSLAGDPRNTQMWSHYSGNHTGVCLQFEVAQDVRTFLQALPIEYTDDYPEINWLGDFRKDLAFANLRKALSWKYENERRIIRLNGANSPLAFQPCALSGLIFGCRSDQAVQSFVRELLRERERNGIPNPQVYYAKREEGNYGLTLSRR